jgi:hypothetical protein
MNTIASKGIVALASVPVAAAGVVAGIFALPDVAHASVAAGVNTRTAGMVLSKEYTAQQKEERGAPSSAMDLQTQQEEAEPDSPAKQERTELKGDMKAAEVKEGALKTVESQENEQTPEPKAHVYTLKTPVDKKLGLMHGGWSQTAR